MFPELLRKPSLLCAVFGLPALVMSLVTSSGAGCGISSSSSPDDETSEDAGKVVFPKADYAAAGSLLAPMGTSTIDTLAVDSVKGVLYASAGAKVFKADAAKGTNLEPWMDLTSSGVASLSTLRIVDGGDLEGASSDQLLRIKTAGGGAVVWTVGFKVPFGGAGFGSSNALAISPDGATLYAVEGGGGSQGVKGDKVAHVGRFVVPAAPKPAMTLDPAETWELQKPFEIVPSSTSFINASSPFVSNDDKTLYVAHVVLRTLFAVTPTGAHTVTAVDTDSLQRSAGSFFLGPTGVLVEAANFDQTVAIFKVRDDLTAKLVVEIPTGGSPSAVASFKNRVFVVQGGGGGFGGFPGDGGFPFGDGGSPMFDGGFMPPMIDGGSTPPSIQIYELTEAP